MSFQHSRNRHSNTPLTGSKQVPPRHISSNEVLIGGKQLTLFQDVGASSKPSSKQHVYLPGIVFIYSFIFMMCTCFLF